MGYDCSIKIWNWNNGRLEKDIKRAHEDIINAGAMLDNCGKLATVSGDENLKLWRISDWKCVQMQEFCVSLNSILKINNEFMAVGANDGKIRIITIKDLDCYNVIDAH